ncbi:MAG: hypothetical protein ACI97N_002334 [Cognaticolwellia sp.]
MTTIENETNTRLKLNIFFKLINHNFKMKKQLSLVVAIFGLAILTSCGNEATEQTQQEQAQVIEQVQTEAPAPAMDSVAVDSTAK